MAKALKLSFENAFYHLFIKTTQPNLSQGIHYLNSSYTNWFRNKHQIIGPIFQRRFKSILVDAGNYALILLAYIHLNSLRVGIVRQLEDYPWSSYLDYLNLRKSNISDPSLVLNLIDNNTLMKSELPNLPTIFLKKKDFLKPLSN